MQFIDTIKSIKKRKYPALREPSQERGFQEFTANYGWVFVNSNKSMGHFSSYKEAEKNVWVSRSINAITEAMLNQGFTIETPENQTPSIERVKYLENVFNSPEGAKSDITFYHLFRQVIHSFLLTGDAFIQINKDKRFDVITGFTFVPAELLCWDNNTQRWCYRTKPSIQYEGDELIHIYNPGIELQNQKWGVSILDSIKEPLKLVYAGLIHNENIINNDGLNPSSILSFDKDITDGAFVSELQRLDALSQQQKEGGTLAIKGATYQNVAQTNRDLDFLELLKFNRDMIVTAFGVPPAKIGIIETSNLGNGSGESQDKTFYDVISSHATTIEVAINKALRESGFSERFKFNMLDIEDKLRRVQIEQTKLNAGILTVNEVRDGYNLPPVEWGDVPNNSNSFSSPFDYDIPNVNTIKKYKNKLVKSKALDDIYYKR